MTIATKGKTADELKTGLHLNSDEEIKHGYKKLLNELHVSILIILGSLN